MKIKNLFLISILFNIGCSIDVKAPGNRFQTSETIGESKKFTVAGALAGMGRVELTDDYAHHFVDEKNPHISYAYSPRVDGNLALTSRFDVGVFYAQDASASLMGKWQFLKHRLGSESSLSSALFFSYGISSDDKGENYGTSTSIDVDFKTSDLGLILGVRLSPTHLLYSGGFFCKILYDGHHTIGSQTRNLDGQFSCNAITYGWEYTVSQKSRVILEGATTNLKTSDSTGSSPTYQKERTINNIGLKYTLTL